MSGFALMSLGRDFAFDSKIDTSIVQVNLTSVGQGLLDCSQYLPNFWIDAVVTFGDN